MAISKVKIDGNSQIGIKIDGNSGKNYVRLRFLNRSRVVIKSKASSTAH